MTNSYRSLFTACFRSLWLIRILIYPSEIVYCRCRHSCSINLKYDDWYGKYQQIVLKKARQKYDKQKNILINHNLLIKLTGNYTRYCFTWNNFTSFSMKYSYFTYYLLPHLFRLLFFGCFRICPGYLFNCLRICPAYYSRVAFTYSIYLSGYSLMIPNYLLYITFDYFPSSISALRFGKWKNM